MMNPFKKSKEKSKDSVLYLFDHFFVAWKLCDQLLFGELEIFLEF